MGEGFCWRDGLSRILSPFTADLPSSTSLCKILPYRSMRLVIQTLLACLFNLSATHAASVARLGVLTRLHAGDGTPLVSSFARMAASANLAAYHINNRIGTLTADGVALLPDNFTVSLDLSDSWSSPTTGVKHAIRWVQEDIHVIIGAYRSAVAGPVAIVASTNDTPVLSWGSSAPALSDKGTYPTFSRVSSTDLVVTSHLIGVVSEMGWINIAVLYVDDSWGRCVPEDLHLPSPRLPPSSVPTRPHLLSLHRPPPASPTSSFLFPLPHLRFSRSGVVQGLQSFAKGRINIQAAVSHFPGDEASISNAIQALAESGYSPQAANTRGVRCPVLTLYVLLPEPQSFSARFSTKTCQRSSERLYPWACCSAVTSGSRPLTS